MEQRDLLSNDLLINNTSQANLVAAAKWGKFLAIVGFLFAALMLIAGIFLQSMLSSGNPYVSDSGFPKYVGITYAIMAIILFFPNLYLLKFSNKIQEAVRSSNQESLDSAFASLKSMLKFYGIFTIIILVFLALAFLGGMGALMQ